MDISPTYQGAKSREINDFERDLRADAIDTANQYIRDRILSDLEVDARLEAMQDLADELSLDQGNQHIVRAIRDRVILEKQALDLQLSSSIV